MREQDELSAVASGAHPHALNTWHFLRSPDAPVLTWSERLHIAAAAAHGIAYLHEDCSPAFIHRWEAAYVTAVVMRVRQAAYSIYGLDLLQPISVLSGLPSSSRLFGGHR